MAPPSADCLPDAAVARLLACLDDPNDLLAAERVCKQWARVCADTRAWLVLAAAHAAGVAPFTAEGATASCASAWLYAARVRRLRDALARAPLAVPALRSALGAATATPERSLLSPTALCKRLLSLAVRPPLPNSIIAEALAATSTARAPPRRMCTAGASLT